MTAGFIYMENSNGDSAMITVTTSPVVRDKKLKTLQWIYWAAVLSDIIAVSLPYILMLFDLNNFSNVPTSKNPSLALFGSILLFLSPITSILPLIAARRLAMNLHRLADNTLRKPYYRVLSAAFFINFIIIFAAFIICLTQGFYLAEFLTPIQADISAYFILISSCFYLVGSIVSLVIAFKYCEKDETPPPTTTQPPRPLTPPPSYQF